MVRIRRFVCLTFNLFAKGKSGLVAALVCSEERICLPSGQFSVYTLGLDWIEMRISVLVTEHDLDWDSAGINIRWKT